MNFFQVFQPAWPHLQELQQHQRLLLRKPQEFSEPAEVQGLAGRRAGATGRLDEKTATSPSSLKKKGRGQVSGSKMTTIFIAWIENDGFFLEYNMFVLVCFCIWDVWICLLQPTYAAYHSVYYSTWYWQSTIILHFWAEITVEMSWTLDQPLAKLLSRVASATRLARKQVAHPKGSQDSKITGWRFETIWRVLNYIVGLLMISERMEHKARLKRLIRLSFDCLYLINDTRRLLLTKTIIIGIVIMVMKQLNSPKSGNWLTGRTTAETLRNFKRTTLMRLGSFNATFIPKSVKTCPQLASWWQKAEG